MKRSRRVATIFVASSLVLALGEGGCATQAVQPETQPPPQAQLQAPVAGARVTQQSSADLDQLVAPIALYPDALVAQILAAATYPTQIVEADRWLQQHSDLKGEALAAAVDPQSWDPSIKAITQFPSLLAMLDQNLSWTSSLGDAYVNGQQNVLDAVQVMRQRAQQAGNLKSTPQENVTDDGQTIVIAPSDPQVVYVPEYDPWSVYGDPLAFYPGWIGVPGVFFDGPGIEFGLGIGIGVFGGFGWGWHHWGADWHHHDVTFDHHGFVSHGSAFTNHHDVGRGHSQLPHSGGLTRGGARPAGLSGGAQAPHGGFSGGAASGVHSSAFSGFNHGGATSALSSRGRASAGGGFHGGGGGGFHGGGGGGFHGGGGGGSHGGGGHR
jgi:hypothetical protein